MHFAICVWGIVRSLRFTIDSIHNYCLDPITNAGHTYEIYMHTYKFSGVYENERSNERGLRLNFSEWQVLKPDHIYLEDQDVFDKSANFDAYHSQGDPWNNNYRSFQNHLRAMNSLNYLALQVERDSKTKHFDGVIYLRPDVTYLNELPFHLIEHIPNTLFVPDFHRSCRGGEYNDRMAMGDLKTGLVYGKKFQAALEYSKAKQLHSEKFVYDYLHMNNVVVKEIPFRFRRTRAKGEFHVRDGTAIVAPRNQQPEPQYTTFCALRWLYTLLELVTYNTVYVWNHDDDENLYCKPHPFLTMEEVLSYRKLSRRKRIEGHKLQMLAPEVSSDSSNGVSGTLLSVSTAATLPVHTVSTDSVNYPPKRRDRTINTPATNANVKAKRRRKKRASLATPFEAISEAFTNTDAERGAGSSVSSVGGSDGRDLSGVLKHSTTNAPQHSALRTNPHTTPAVAAEVAKGAFSLRGVASRELEEHAARLKKARSLQDEKKDTA